MNRTLLTKSVLVMAIMGSSLSAGASTSEKPGLGASIFAAEPATYLTKEQVIQLMKKLPVYAEGYTEKEVSLHENIAFYPNGAVWSSYWAKENDGNESLHIDVDATTGKLVQFVKATNHKKQVAADDHLSKAEALKKAEAFLQTVAPDEYGRVSKANKYQVGDASPQVMGHAFVYARVENDILFPENYLQVIVDSNGEVGSYTRVWYEGKLPSPVPTISMEEATKRWEESVKPTLHYIYPGQQIGKYGLPLKKMILAYSYDEKSPIFIDAMTNQSITILGESSSLQPPIVPLGTSTRAAGVEQIKLEDFDKREKADQIALTMFRAVPDQQAHKVSVVSTLTWDEFGEGSSDSEVSYSYARPDIGTEKEMKFSLGLDDYGEITSFSVDEEPGAIANRIYPNPIPYRKAMAVATDFMKKLYPDRQGELYAIYFPPTEESKKEMFEQKGGYDITFGWLKQGIPVNGLESGVTVDPASGEVKGMFTFPAYQSLQSIEVQKPGIDVNEAKLVEKGKKELRLTYFMPHPEWRTGTYLVSREPRLVYRMIGDEGVVDATSGQWVSYTDYKQSKIPQDIANHPQYKELLQAVEDGYFPVINGKLEPDQPVTRGELLRILLKVDNNLGFSRFYHEVGEEEKLFTDIEKGHPLYEIVLEATRVGVIQAPVSQLPFYPERTVTNAEANEMISRLTEGKIIISSQPVRRMTKADVALLLMKLNDYAQSSEQN